LQSGSKAAEQMRSDKKPLLPAKKEKSDVSEDEIMPEVDDDHVRPAK